jgi:phage shock protein E
MSKHSARSRQARAARPNTPPPSAQRAERRRQTTSAPRSLGSVLRRPAGLAAGLLGAVAIIAVAVVALSGLGGGSVGTVEQGNGGSWTNIHADTLADWLTHKDFTLLNVKTPYVGEIDGTDLYIPYSEIDARAAELPQDRSAKLVVYCRAGNESRVALQALIDLGYTNLYNLDKGMEEWTASGRQLVQKSRG